MSAERPVPPYCPTAAEVAERQEFVNQLHAKHTRECTIKRLFREKFGDVSARTVGNYLSRARADRLMAITTARTTLRAESLALYQRLADDETVSARDRIRAQERIDKLLALELRPDLVAADDMRDMLTYDPDATREPAGPLPGTDAGPDGGPGGGADALPRVGD